MTTDRPIRVMTKRELAVRKVEEQLNVSLAAARWIVDRAEAMFAAGRYRTATGAVRAAYREWIVAGPR